MPIQKTCLGCGVDFFVKPCEDSKKFCTKPCRHEYESINGRVAKRVACVEFNCKTCGESFGIKPGFLAQYRKKHAHDPMYCSRKCTGIGRRQDTAAEQVFSCLECGREVPRRRYERSTGHTKYYSQQKFCSYECKSANQRTAALARFNTALATGEGFNRHEKRGGYMVISVPSGVTGKKQWIFEHRFVMSQHIGRDLFPEETVHHINGDRKDNRIENLELFSSRHGPGQRVIDKIAFAVEMIQRYPEFAAAQGFRLVQIESESVHATDRLGST